MTDTAEDTGQQYTGQHSLSERLRKRAARSQARHKVSAISSVIEARNVLAEQREKGLSWDALTELLAHEQVHISAGTLRNYMRLIGRAVDRLAAAGIASPTDAEINADLHFKCLQPTSRPPAREPRAPASMPLASARHAGSISPAPSLMRRRDREN